MFAHAQPAPGDADLIAYSVHVNRTPQQSWPGYGVYLGAGLILTAAHVPAEVAETKPRIAIAGLDLPTTLVRQGSLEGTDLTLLSVDATRLPAPAENAEDAAMRETFLPRRGGGCGDA